MKNFIIIYKKFLYTNKRYQKKKKIVLKTFFFVDFFSMRSRWSASSDWRSITDARGIYDDQGRGGKTGIYGYTLHSLVHEDREKTIQKRCFHSPNIPVFNTLYIVLKKESLLNYNTPFVLHCSVPMGGRDIRSKTHP